MDVSPTDFGILNWINGVLDANPCYLQLYRNMMQVNLNQYIASTSWNSKQPNIGLIGEFEEFT